MEQPDKTYEAVDATSSHLEQQLEYKNVLLQVTQQLASAFDLTKTMPSVVESTCQVLKADSARIILTISNTKMVFSAGDLPATLVEADQAVLEAARNNGPTIINDPGRLKDLGIDAVMKAVAIWPLQQESRFQGALWIGFKEARDLTPGEHDLIGSVVLQTSAAITNMRLFQKAQNGRTWLEAVVGSTSDPVLVVDQDRCILLLNHAAEELLGLTESVALEQSVTEVLKDFPKLLQFFENDVDFAEDEEWESPDGRAFSPRLSRVETNERQSGSFVMTLRDITPFKLLNRNQAEFVRLVSHDLRSPLTFMQGYASLLNMMGELNDRQEEFVEKILNGISQMTTLVDNIQDAGRWDPQTGFYEMAREASDLTATIQDIVANHQEVARKQGVRLTSTIAPNIPIVNVDNLMVERALINLVGNAIKYSPKGGDIDISIEVKDESVLICVRDTGLGIAPENLGELFKRGTRIVTQEVKEARIKGSGLGLFIVRSVARRHGGDVWAESKLGQGSSFYFSLPLSGPNILGGDR